MQGLFRNAIECIAFSASRTFFGGQKFGGEYGERRRLGGLDVVAVLLLLSTNAFSFHNLSSSHFANTLVTTLSTIAPCRIFKLSPNYLLT